MSDPWLWLRVMWWVSLPGPFLLAAASASRGTAYVWWGESYLWLGTLLVGGVVLRAFGRAFPSVDASGCLVYAGSGYPLLWLGVSVPCLVVLVASAAVAMGSVPLVCVVPTGGC